MRFPKKEQVEKLRQQYPQGCRVQLDEMDDSQAPPIGTQGTVRGVDDTGSIMVSWDNGSSLNVVYGADKCHRIDTVTTPMQPDTEVVSIPAQKITVLTRPYTVEKMAATKDKSYFISGTVALDFCELLNADFEEGLAMMSMALTGTEELIIAQYDFLALDKGLVYVRVSGYATDIVAQGADKL